MLPGYANPKTAFGEEQMNKKFLLLFILFAGVNTLYAARQFYSGYHTINFADGAQIWNSAEVTLVDGGQVGYGSFARDMQAYVNTPFFKHL